jgi:hypothetical protein
MAVDQILISNLSGKVFDYDQMLTVNKDIMMLFFIAIH